jgi:hypothetical protein
LPEFTTNIPTNLFPYDHPFNTSDNSTEWPTNFLSFCIPINTTVDDAVRISKHEAQ